MVMVEIMFGNQLSTNIQNVLLVFSYTKPRFSMCNVKIMSQMCTVCSFVHPFQVTVFTLDLKFEFHEMKRNEPSGLKKQQGLSQTHHGHFSFLLFHSEDAGSNLDGEKGF